MKIFVSSTFVDLRMERQAVIDALSTAHILARAMEFFPSEPSAPLHVALRNLQESDAMILIIGFRGGSLIPESAEMTYTAAEFDHAIKLKKPVFVFIKTEDGAWKNEEPDGPVKSALDQFKGRVCQTLQPAQR